MSRVALGRGRAGRRLVDEQHRRAGRIRRREHQHAAGRRTTAAAAGRVGAGARTGAAIRSASATNAASSARACGVDDERADEAAAPAPSGRADEHVLEWRQRREHRGRLERANDTAGRVDLPASGAIGAGEQTQDGCLARAVRADERGDRAGRSGDVDVLRGGDPAEPLARPVAVEAARRPGAAAACPRCAGARGPDGRGRPSRARRRRAA